MWKAATLKQYTDNLDPVRASQQEMTAAYVAIVTKGERAAIGAAILAHFIEKRGLTFQEAAKETGRSESSMKRDAARATVVMQLPESDAVTVWTHLKSMKDSEARALGESLALMAESERLDYFIEHAAADVVETRVGDAWTSEEKDSAAAYVVSQGIATRDRMKDPLIAYAKHHGMVLPTVKRTPQLEEGATTPTAARVATAAALFQKDREQGSEGAEFEVSDAEAADLVRAVETSIRTLRMAGRVEDLDVIAGFLAESVALLDA